MPIARSYFPPQTVANMNAPDATPMTPVAIHPVTIQSLDIEHGYRQQPGANNSHGLSDARGGSDTRDSVIGGSDTGGSVMRERRQPVA